MRFAKSSGQSRNITAALREAEPMVYCPVDQFDNAPYRLNCKNCTTVCPAGVDIAGDILDYKAAHPHRRARRVISLFDRRRLFSGLMKTGALFNALTHSKPGRKITAFLGRRPFGFDDRTELPRPAFTSADDLPGDFVPVQATYQDEIRLIGYAGYDSNLASDGYLVIELFWEALRRPAADYVVTFRWQNTQTGAIERVVNTQLGTHSTPQRLPTSWPAGTIYYERYLFDLPALEADAPLTFDLLVGLYDEAAQTLLPVTAADHAVSDNHLRLTGAGGWPEDVASAENPPSQVVWNDALSLTEVTCTVDEDGLTLTLDWLTQARPAQAWHVFIHARAGDTTLAQHDAPPVPPHPTDSWRAGVALQTTWQEPSVTGPATILLGFYDPFTLARVPITRSELASDNDAVSFDCPTAP